MIKETPPKNGGGKVDGWSKANFQESLKRESALVCREFFCSIYPHDGRRQIADVMMR